MDAGKANAAVTDEDVLKFAAAEKRILLSHNRRHFLRLHLHRRVAHSGVVPCTVDADFIALARRIDSTVAAMAEMDDQLVRVNRPG